jgi:hypothetical protein
MKEFTAIFDCYKGGKGFFRSIRLRGGQLVKDSLIFEELPSGLKHGDLVEFKANIRFEEINDLHKKVLS